MAPKVKYTKEQITNAAVEIVRKSGMEALSARSLAKEMNCSSQPIFSHFENMEDVQNSVIKKAKDMYSEYLHKGLKEPVPFKGAGLKYIEFAKNEPEMFSLLFMSETDTNGITHFLPSFDDNAPEVLLAVKNTYSLDDDKAKRLYNHMAVYTHGLAVLYARKACIFTMEDIGRMLTEVFMALIKEL